MSRSIKERIAVLETMEKEITEILTKNATRIITVPEFNSRFCTQQLKLFSGNPCKKDCDKICSKCKNFVTFNPSSYISTVPEPSYIPPMYQGPVVPGYGGLFHYPVTPSTCPSVTVIPGWCLNKSDEGDDEDVHIVEEDGVRGQSEENNSSGDN